MIEIRDLSGALGEFCLKDIDLTVNDGEYFVLLGPTGAGKTVLIEYIVGIYRQDNGAILVDGEDITPLYTEERNIAYVPQDYALFPNLTVEKNIAYGLEAKRLPKSEIKTIVDRVIAKLEIDYIRHRMPLHLSGGEKQRVALGRALATRPSVVLLDEPLSALDENLRANMAGELRKLQQETGATFIHVCHSFEEAADVADRIAIMESGRIVQTGTISEIATTPQNEFVARFMKTRNIFNAVADNSLVSVGSLRLKTSNALQGDVVVGIRPENISFLDAASDGCENLYTGTVQQTMWRPHCNEVVVDVGVLLVVYCDRDVPCAQGTTVSVRIPPDKIIVMPRT